MQVDFGLNFVLQSNIIQYMHIYIYIYIMYTEFIILNSYDH